MQVGENSGLLPAHLPSTAEMKLHDEHEDKSSYRRGNTSVAVLEGMRLQSTDEFYCRPSYFFTDVGQGNRGKRILEL
ncbi:MAG: hypothetical protein QHH26_09020 [Armatimonadota bacterium]|nr:hypothetical protein [Armatimonadota bacterium]